LALVLLAVLSLWSGALSAAEPTRHFEFPAGDAAEVLQKFVDFTGVQLVFPARALGGITTRPLRGDYTVAEALTRLLSDTGLEIVRDGPSGALAVRRLAAPPLHPKTQAPSPAPPPGKPAENIPTTLPAMKVERRRFFSATTPSLLPTNRAAPLYYHVVTREEIEQSGVTTMAEFLTTVPGYSGEGAESLQASADLTLTNAANVYGGSFLKLRGWDSQHTTVLVNGRELPPSPESRGPDLSRIPLAAVERIDVLPFAGSALYGDGAVGGAMNIVLRRDFTGSSASLQLGNSTRGGGGEVFFTWVEGLASKDGRTKATLIGDFQRRGALQLGDRDFLSRAMSRLRPEELLPSAAAKGTDRRALLSAWVTGYPAVFAVSEAKSDLGIAGQPGAEFALVPTGRNAATVPRTAFVETDPAALRERRQNRVVVRRPTESFNFNVQLEHALAPDVLEFYGELGYSRATESFAAPDQVETLGLDFLDSRNPFRADVATGFLGRDVTLFFDPVDLPDARFRQTRDSARAVLGVRGTPSGRWHWSLDSFVDASRAHTSIDAYGASLNELLRRWTPEKTAIFSPIYDPLADHRAAPVSVDTRERYLASQSWLDYRSRMFGAEARVGGTVRDLPAGPLQVSFGAEYESRHRVTRQKTDASRELYVRMDALPSFETLTRLAESSDRGERIGALAEATVPLWREGLRGLPVHAADLNYASRVARTDGGHAAVSNLAALKIALSPSWAVRGTWSQGYVAPSGVLVNSPVMETLTTTSVLDPLRGNIRQLYPLRVTTGGGSSLRPETTCWECCSRPPRSPGSSFPSTRGRSPCAIGCAHRRCRNW
jgi:iron complex outermembrane receptor protein